MFDDINKNDDDCKSTSDNKDSITMTREDLQELIDNIKTRYVAEIDAIMLEQQTYKRIILQMVHKLKHHHLDHNKLDLQKIETKKL